MKNKIIYSFICCFTLLIVGCSDEPLSEDQLLLSKDLTYKKGATQISGNSTYADVSHCDYVSLGADFALTLTGELEGCLYIFVEEYECSPSGTYREEGRELFVGNYNGGSGSFMTTYKLQAKYEGCEDGMYVGAEIFGRCHHPIIKGSGTGIFEGVSGRLDFVDDVVLVEFPYKGHLKY